MKKGDKVIYIGQTFKNYTKYKEYIINDIFYRNQLNPSLYFSIIDNLGINTMYSINDERFKTIIQLRKDKLNKINENSL